MARSQLSTEVKLGAVILGSIMIFVFGILWLKDYKFTVSGYEVEAMFDDITGLKLNDPVYIKGFKVGKVLAMTLQQDGVMTTLWIDNRSLLPVDSKAYVRSRGVMGEKFVEIVLGTAEQVLQEGNTLTGEYYNEVDRLMSLTDSMGDELEGVLKGLRKTLTDTLADNLAGTLVHTHQTARQLHNLLDRKGDQVAVTIDNLQAFSATLNELSSTEKERIHRLLEIFEQNAQSLQETSERLTYFTLVLEEMGSKLQQGEGTLGRLVQDESLYQHMEQTLTEVDSLIADIKAHPRRYFSFSVFSF